jgi:hypothetical protein
MAPDPEFPPGDRNVLSVLLRKTKGSRGGPRANEYKDVSGPTWNIGVGNRLEFVGSVVAFAQSNKDIDPPPPCRFFTGSD